METQQGAGDSFLCISTRNPKDYLHDQHGRIIEPIVSKDHQEPRLGRGGNGTVWLAERGGQQAALKLLNVYDPNSEPFRRFRDEVKIMNKLNGRLGVLPFVASSIPDQPTWKDPAWLAMPVCRAE